MRPELIVMLTHYDKTVPNAIEMFEVLQSLPGQYWGFKDVGLPHDQMKKLVGKMKDALKTTLLEVVSLSEEEGLSGARLAVEAGFDILMGTVFFDSIHDFLQDKPIKYYPFPGHVYSHPSILEGTIDGIAEHANQLQSKGVQGLDLLAYRYIGDARQLLKKVVQATEIPVVSAGSIASFSQIAAVWDAGAWGFTIGSAFFEKKFIPDGSFEQNLMAVWDWLEKTDEAGMRNQLDVQ
jgi:hypothetical protein